MSKKKRTISVSFDESQIQEIDKQAREERKLSGDNVTRSQIVRRIVDASLGKQHGSTPPSPAGNNTPLGGRSGERSDDATGGIEDGQEG